MSGSFKSSFNKTGDRQRISPASGEDPGEAGIRGFFSSLGLLVILNLLVKPVWIFFIDRQVQLETGPDEYGKYFALLNLSIILSFLLDLGFTTYFNRQLAFYKENFISQTGNFLLLKILLIFLYAVLMLGTARISGITEINLLVSLIIIQSLTSLFLFFRSVITARQWFRTDAWLSVFDKTLLILVCGSLLYFPAVFETITIKKFLVLQMACTGLAVICALGILLRRGISFMLDRPFFISRKLWIAAFPFGLVILLMGTHYRVDGFLLDRLKSPGEAGLYAAAYRLLDAANMVGYLFASFLLPFIARRWQERKEITEVVLVARHSLFLFSLFIVITVVFLSTWIIHLLYGEKIPGAGTILAWAMPALLGYSLVQVYGTVLTASGFIKQFCGIVFLSVILNIILNLLLIPAHGALGACYSAVISHGCCGIACMIYCRIKLDLPILIGSWFLYLGAAIVLSLAFIGFHPVVLLIGATFIILALLLLFKRTVLNYWLKLKTSVT